MVRLFGSLANATTALKSKKKETKRSTRTRLLLCTRKGLWWRFAPVSWLCESGCSAHKHHSLWTTSAINRRPSRDFPVTGDTVLAYSCAAARDSHPLPSPERALRTREPKLAKSNAGMILQLRGEE